LLPLTKAWGENTLRLVNFTIRLVSRLKAWVNFTIRWVRKVKDLATLTKAWGGNTLRLANFTKRLPGRTQSFGMIDPKLKIDFRGVSVP
jgi:hypothetical protein